MASLAVHNNLRCDKWFPTNLAFWQVQTQTSLCSLLLSLETPIDVWSVALMLNSHRIFKRLAKALIRLGICAGWSETLSVAHTTLLLSRFYDLLIFGRVMSPPMGCHVCQHVHLSTLWSPRVFIGVLHSMSNCAYFLLLCWIFYSLL